MARAVPNVFTIAPGLPFVRLVVGELLAGRLLGIPFGEEPHRLADLTIHVPTQRVRKIVEEEFIRALAPRPAILPRIRPLAEPGDPLRTPEETEAEVDDVSADAFAGGRVIGPLERRFLLLPLVRGWLRGIRTEAGEALAGDAGLREELVLAEELGRLIDEMRIAELPLAMLEAAAPPGYDEAKHDVYWAKSREFLQIAARAWPGHLQEIAARDEMDVRLEGIEAEARRIAGGAGGPVLVLGSTGSVPATARLMRAVSRHEQGAVVLPGLDLSLDEAAWKIIGDGEATIATRFAHPQASLKNLLPILGIGRADVATIGETETARNRAISEALRPAETIDLWRQRVDGPLLAAALDGLDVIEAAEEREEGLAVALLMRETLENPEASVVCVTANRKLAERIRAELRRWGIDVEDSAGIPLAETPAGRLLLLLFRAASEQDGGAILALLRDPLVGLGFDRAVFAALVDAMEILVFRGRHFSKGEPLSTRLSAVLEREERHAHPAAKRIDAEIRAELPVLAKALDDLFGRLVGADAPGRLDDFASMLCAAMLRLTEGSDGQTRFGRDAHSGRLLMLLEEIGIHGADARMEPAEALSAIELLVRGEILPPTGGHPRAAILGPLESRLVEADRIILAGLNEGSFPPAAREGPFLNRTMRLELGLQPPERRIGQSAHDFAMLTGARHVVVTRSRREGESPALASRFLRRLRGLVGEEKWRTAGARGARILALARRMEEPPGPARPCAEPVPVPRAPRVPEKLSVTEIETLRRDPYAIYAKHLLGLVPLEPIEPELDVRERGTVLHACLEDYVKSDPPLDPGEAADQLIEIGRKHFDGLRHDRELHEFWWQRFRDIVPAFVAFDRERREQGWTVLAERYGKIEISLPDGERIAITGRADRIEIRGGERAIFDDLATEVRGGRQ
ncbi:MAG TPA: double-strand break repair protein AddB, partial [Rhabdaerophilum sp.]|nr:double-strand break repair protein AddB [Rhabdaerophilum sp.]